MVRKKLAVAILALGTLQAGLASALGLGNLSIKSALNQPLNAEIKLLDTGDLDPTQVRIQLAAPEDFQRSGVDRDFFLTNLRFAVVMDGRGGGTIHITTNEPVVEPYLNFVVEARWPSGRLLREFAVLLDPPTFSAAKGATSIAPAQSGQPAKKPGLQPPTVATETQATRTVPEADMSLPASGAPGEYRVQVYDTLSKIAARFKPASDVSVAQTMLAIQRANPDAFINNNINLIKSGAVVRLPSADEARAVPTDRASQEAEEQTQAWRSGSGASAASTAASGPQLDARAPAPATGEGGYSEKARLSIAAPGGSDKSSAGEGSGAGGTAALRDQLTSSQEALEKGKRDNRELQSRLDDMDRQLATLQRLISLKDDQLAALQAKTDSTGASQPADAATAVPPAAPAESAPESSTPAADIQEPSVAVPAVRPQPAAPAANPAAVAKAAPPVAPKPSLLDQLSANPLYLGGALAALLALIAAVIWKRRKDAEEDESDDEFVFDDNDSFAFDGQDSSNDNGSDEGRVSDDGLIDAAPVAAAPMSTGQEAQKALRPETADAIAESDIYIAYGRYQQAVDLLSTAIDAEPTRVDLRVKLLEVFVEMRNKEAFGKQFVALQGLGDSQAVAQVKDMLSSVDGVSDWLDDLPGGSSAPNYGAAAVGATGLAAAAAFDANSMPVQASEAAIDEELDLDLDLDDDMDAEFEAGPSLDLPQDFDAELELEEPDDSSPEGELLENDLLEEDFTLDADDLEAAGAATVGDEIEFSLDLDADSEAASSQELSDLSMDFDTPATPVPASTTHSDSSSAQLVDEGFELDLGDDDLDDMLGEFDGAGTLTDLQDLSAEPPAPAGVIPERPELDLSEEFDLSNAGEDLAADFGDLEALGDFEAPLSEPQAQPSSFSAYNTTTAPEAINESAFESELEPELREPTSEQELEQEVPIIDSSDDFDFLSDADEVGTKLDLARAYIDMGDTDGARDILDEVLQEGTDTQKEEASTLLSRIG